MNNNYIEFLKLFGINGTVLGVTTLTSLELVLKIILLFATICWTVIKIVEAINSTKRKETNASIQRPKNRKKKDSELLKKRRGSGKKTRK